MKQLLYLNWMGLIVFGLFGCENGQIDEAAIATAREYVVRADSLSKIREIQEAMPLLEEANLIFYQNKAWEDWVETQNSLATNYRFLGEYDRSLEILEEGIVLGGEKIGANHLKVYQLVLIKGTVLYSRGGYKDAVDLISGMLLELEKHFDKNDRLFMQAYSHLSIYYEKSKALDKALECSQKALAIGATLFSEDELEYGINLERVGNNLIMLEDFEAALSYHSRAFEIRKQVFKEEDHPRMATVYTNIGICYAQLGKLKEAEFNFVRTIEIYRKTFGDQHPSIAASLWNLGRFYYEANKLPKALATYQKELTMREQLGNDPVSMAENHNRLGVIYQKLKQPKAAMASHNQALSLVSKDFNARDIYATPSLDQLIYKEHSLKYLRDKLAALYDYIQSGNKNRDLLELSLVTGDLCLAIWKELRYELGLQEQSKQHQSELTRNGAQFASLLAWQYFQDSGQAAYARKAWQLAEESKSLLLFAAYDNARDGEYRGLSRKLTAREKDISAQLAGIESQLLTAVIQRDSAKIATLQNEQLFAAKSDYDQLLLEIAEENPTYFNLKYSTETAGVSAVQNLLEKDQIFLEYLVEKETGELLIFVIEKDRPLQIFRQDLPANVAVTTTEFYRLLQSYQLNTTQKKERFVELSHSLYQLLLKPLAQQLAGKKKMIVVGEDFINYIPFEVLLPTAEVKNFSELDFLIRQLEISYHYSATLFVRSKRENNTFKGDLFAFAPVFDQEEDHAIAQRAIAVDTTLRSFTRDGRFSSLVHSEEEVKTIARLFRQKGYSKQQILLKEEATEQALKEALLGNYRYVHLASHSFSNLRRPELSGIACALPEASKEENGILFSGEIYNIEMNTDLLVLSSCESGLGKIVEGEGMLGLNRGFVHAGVPNVVFSLWKVYDRVSSQMMEEFYTQILAGASYSAALQKAKLRLLDNETTASPHYWSAFLLIGR